MSALLRLAESAANLARDVEEPRLAAQISAISALLTLQHQLQRGQSVRERELAVKIAAAIEREDEETALTAARQLAAIERASVPEVDWTALSGD